MAINTINMETAIVYLKRGRKIKREGWNNKYLQLKDNHNINHMNSGESFRGLIITEKDILATDWLVID